MSEAFDMAGMLESYAGFDPDPPYWFYGSRIDYEGFYCWTCAEIAVFCGLAEGVDGGWSGQSESDTCMHCVGCDDPLYYWLSEYGVEYELGHFQRYTSIRPLSRETAFHIARLVESAKDLDVALHSALRLGRRATWAIPREARAS